MKVPTLEELIDSFESDQTAEFVSEIRLVNNPIDFEEELKASETNWEVQRPVINEAIEYMFKEGQHAPKAKPK